jgi:hypothetical protein
VVLASLGKESANHNQPIMVDPYFLDTSCQYPSRDGA